MVGREKTDRMVWDKTCAQNQALAWANIKTKLNMAFNHILTHFTA